MIIVQWPVWIVVSCHYRKVDDKVVNVAEQINKEVMQCLNKHDFPAMDAAKQTLLKGQIQSVASSEHSVHKLMSKSIPRAFRSQTNE